jgi:hypothetical protein
MGARGWSWSEGVEWEGENERRPSRRGRSRGGGFRGENQRGQSGRGRMRRGWVYAEGWSQRGRSKGVE